MTQKQIDKGGESPVVINERPGPGLVRPTTNRHPSLIFPASARILPWPSTIKEAQGDPLDAIEGALNLRARIHQCAYGTRQRHNTVLPLLVGRDGDRPPRTKQQGSRGAVDVQVLPRLEPLLYPMLLLLLLLWWLLLLALEQFLQLLLPLPLL